MMIGRHLIALRATARSWATTKQGAVIRSIMIGWTFLHFRKELIFGAMFCPQIACLFLVAHRQDSGR